MYVTIRRLLAACVFSVFAMSFSFIPLASAGEWDIRISVIRSSSGELIKNDLVAGVRNSGSDAFDNLWDSKALDSSFSPSETAVNFAVFFNHPEYEAGKDMLWRDIRGVSLPASWDMSVLTDPQAQITLHWNLPEENSCSAPEFELTDIDNQLTLNMKTQDTYSFVSGTGSNSFIMWVYPGEVRNSPPPPINIWIPMRSRQSLMLVWEQGGSGVKGYNIYRREVMAGNSGFKRINSTLNTVNKYLDTNLELNKHYKYVVTAIGICESSPSAEMDFITQD